MYQPLESHYLSAAATSILLALTIWLAYLWLLPKPLAGVPHNPIVSVWGDIHDIVAFTKGKNKTFTEYVAAMVAKHGPISQIMVGRSPILVVADRAEVERLLLRAKCTDQSKRTNEIFATVVPTGQISLPANETWKRHRRLTGPSMSRRYLERMSSRILVGAAELVRLWMRKVDLVGSQPFDGDMDLQLATLDTIVDIAMGASPGCIDDAYTSLSATSIRSPSPPFYTALRSMMQSIEYTSQAAFPSLTARLLVWPFPVWRRSYRLLTTFFNDKIREAKLREATGEEGRLAVEANCVLDMVVQREAREKGERLGEGELLDELMTFVIAGQDTTASALAWLVKYLPLDMDVQQRLRDELLSVLGEVHEPSRPLNFEALDSAERMPVLEAVVAETLRCAGVASLSGRELTDDQVICGRHIPKGTQLMFPIMLMSTQVCDWGPDATIWRPTRWLNSDGLFNRAAGPSMPFGLGQRACFGQRLAVLQLKIFTAVLVQSFVFMPTPSGMANWDAQEIVTRQPKVCFVSLKKWAE